MNIMDKFNNYETIFNKINNGYYNQREIFQYLFKLQRTIFINYYARNYIDKKLYCYITNVVNEEKGNGEFKMNIPKTFLRGNNRFNIFENQDRQDIDANQPLFKEYHNLLFKTCKYYQICGYIANVNSVSLDLGEIFCPKCYERHIITILTYIFEFFQNNCIDTRYYCDEFELFSSDNENANIHCDLL